MGWVERLAPALLVVAAVLVYSNSLRGAYLLDDYHFIVQNPTIRDGNMPRLVSGAGTRAFVLATFAANYAIGGLDNRGMHVVNITIHTLAAIVLFGVVRRTMLLPSLTERYGRFATGLALTVALLWLVHPLQTQAVTYLVQRCESLMGLFYLLCIYTLLRGSQSKLPWLWYGISALTLWLGMTCKESMATAPAVAILFDRLLIAQSWREVLRQRGWLYGLFALPLAVAAPTIVRTLTTAQGASVGLHIKAFTPLEFAATQPGVILHYLRLALVPYPQCFDYDWPIARTTPGIVLPAVLLAGVLIGGLWLGWRRPAIALLTLAFFLTLAPSSSIVPIRDLAVEHRMYLPLAPLLTGLVIGVFELLQVRHLLQRRHLAVGLAPLVAIVWGGLTFARNSDYHSAEAMWRDVIAKAPHNPRAYSSLAHTLLEQRRYDESLKMLERSLALGLDTPENHTRMANVLVASDGDRALAAEHAERAVELDPTYALGHEQLGVVRAQQGRLPDAAKAFRAALKLSPNSALAHYNLARILRSRGEFDTAAEHLERALAIDPAMDDARQILASRASWVKDDPAREHALLVAQARAAQRAKQLSKAEELFEQALAKQADDALAMADLGVVLAELGRLREAEQHTSAAVAIAPQNASIRNRVGMMLMHARRFAEARTAFEDSLTLDDHLAETHLLLGNVADALGETPAAIASYRAAIQIDPQSSSAHNNLGSLLSATDLKSALEHFEAAIRIDPDYVEAYNNMANALARHGHLEKSVAVYRKALQLQPNFAPARRNLQAVLQMLRERRGG